MLKLDTWSHIDFQATGTFWNIHVSPADKESLFQLEKKILKFVDDFENVYSRFRKNSLVSKIAESKGVFVFPENADALFSIYRDFYDFTERKFTPLIGKSLNESGYDSSYSFQSKQISQVDEWDEVMKWDSPALVTQKPLQLDFGAAGKGYLIDLIADMIRLEGIEYFVIDGGGDMKFHVPEPMRIGFENPRNEKEVVGYMDASRGAICSSAANRRSWGEYHHILDPELRASSKKIIASWVIAESALLADAFATSFFLADRDVVPKKYTVQYVLLDQELNVSKSDNFTGKLFIK